MAGCYRVSDRGEGELGARDGEIGGQRTEDALENLVGCHLCSTVKPHTAEGGIAIGPLLTEAPGWEETIEEGRGEWAPPRSWRVAGPKKDGGWRMDAARWKMETLDDPCAASALNFWGDWHRYRLEGAPVGRTRGGAWRGLVKLAHPPPRLQVVASGRVPLTANH